MSSSFSDVPVCPFCGSILELCSGGSVKLGLKCVNRFCVGGGFVRRVAKKEFVWYLRHGFSYDRVRMVVF